MTLIEKIVLILIILLLLFICGSVYKTVSAINEAGGIKQLIINTGKEVEDISKKIKEDNDK
jgi:competence protein ComGC